VHVRLLELQGESDARQACAAAGRSVPDTNLRGWAALVPLQLAAALRESGVVVLQGGNGALALGSLAQLWNAARSVEGTLEKPPVRALAAELKFRAAAVESSFVPGASNDLVQWKLPRTALPAGRTLIMGILNVTPDSFSDGGMLRDAEEAIERGVRLVESGADILDVGGESTNPFGAQPVEAAEERRRVEPVIRGLVRRARVPVSCDTTKAAVAEAAIDAGAEIVNDVSGLARDPAMGPLIARTSSALCLMHMRGTPADMQKRAVYADLHGEVLAELELALRRARDAGVPEGHCAIDPGLGFAKTAEQNLGLLRRLRELWQLGAALIVGASRKSFIGKATGRTVPSERTQGSVAAAVAAALNGAAVVRVHDVAATREALLLADAVRTSTA
jgi:dihydropteroate synthase